jgi:hypothetical protein
MTYDLRRLRMHGLIERIPGTFRYQATDTGITQALFLTRLHDKFLRTGLAKLTAPPGGTGRDLATASRAYTIAIDDLARQGRPRRLTPPASPAGYPDLQAQELDSELKTPVTQAS